MIRNMTPHFIAIAAVSLDGRIARHTKDMSTDWTSEEDKLYMRSLLKTCDAVLVGRSTYEVAYKPLSKRMCMVVTRSVTEPVQENELRVNINPAHTDLREYAKQRGWEHIAILGGAQVYALSFERGLIDELHMTVEPVVFGSGVSFVEGASLDSRFQLKDMRKLNERGSVVLVYDRIHGAQSV